jgi:hypothetical protein
LITTPAYLLAKAIRDGISGEIQLSIELFHHTPSSILPLPSSTLEMSIFMELLPTVVFTSQSFRNYMLANLITNDFGRAIKLHIQLGTHFILPVPPKAIRQCS